MKNKIIGVFILALSIYGFVILTSSITEVNTGIIGEKINWLFHMSVGSLSYFIMTIALLYAIFLMAINHVKIKKVKLAALILLIICSSIMLVILSSSSSALQANYTNELLSVGGSGHSGGMLGAGLSLMLYPYIGKSGIILLDLACIIASILILFDEMIKHSVKKLKERAYIRSIEKLNKETQKAEEKISKKVNKEKILPFEAIKNKKEPQKVDTPSNKLERASSIVENDKTPLSEQVGPSEIKKTNPAIDNAGVHSIEQGMQKRFNAGIKPPVVGSVVRESASDISDEKKKNAQAVEAIFNETKVSSVDEPAQRAYFEKKIELLEEALLQHNVEAKVEKYVVGPVITRFELSIQKGVRVKKVSSLSDDIAMNLEAKSIRIEAPIPGKNLIGIEIPNKKAEAVHFSELVKDKAFRDNPSELAIILGKDIVGNNIVIDLKKMPHLLIAGRTGSGKSVCINTLISSILLKSGPDKVRFIMVDPKMVELMPYNDIKHLLVPVITEPKAAAIALRWAVNEMEDRYKKLSALGVRNIEGYNEKSSEDFMYFIVIIIDEFADLMMVAPGTLEESIARISQKARAVGIHLVMATQRPSTDVITGTIKANLPSRISFSVASQIDSRTILNYVGAEKLLGRGDMLYSESSTPNLTRIQGAFISDDEVIRLTKHLKKQGKPDYNNDIIVESSVSQDDVDDMYDQAIELLEGQQRVSTSYLQRKLRVGYSRAARIVDQMQENGVINDNKEVM